MMDTDDRPFPIQQGHNWNKRASERPIIRYGPCTIPWWLAEEAYKVYVSNFGSQQSLERIAQRGGFSRKELIWLLSKVQNKVFIL